MQSLLKTLQRIVRDITAGRHLESYVIAFAAFVFMLLTIIEDVLTIDAQLAVLMAAAGLLVFKTTSPTDQIPDLDKVLEDRQSFGPFREFIRGGRELWIYAPSGVNILVNAPDIEREVLMRGGSMRMILQDPSAKATMKMLYRQLDHMSHMLSKDIERSVSILESLQKRHTQVDYRLLPETPGFSLVIIDPDGRDGRLIVEFFGYNAEHITDRMHITITRQQSQHWFEHWAGQFERMWELANEIGLTQD